MLKNMLQNAVSHVPFLRDVSSREHEAIMHGFEPYSYEDYKTLLESSATTYDESKVGKRSVNKLNVIMDDEESDDEQQEFAIHFTKGKLLGASMNKETWNSLDKEEQALWDKLKDATKRKILQYTKERAAKKEAKVNVVAAKSDDDDSSSSEEPDPPSEDQEKTEGNEDTHTIMKAAIIKNILEEAKSEAHPGDVRRMLGKKKAATAKVKFTKMFGDDDSVASGHGSDFEAVDALIDAYWDDESQEDFHRGD